MGAFGATYFALFFSDLPKLVLLPLMLIAGLICGGLWALIPALPKAFWNVNETISSLLLNYVAYFWIAFLVYGPWKDPKGNNFPLTKQFSEGATIPIFGNTRISYAVFLMLFIAIVMFILIKYSKWGYEIRVSGSSRKAADYAGMSYIKNVLMVMFFSGALSGVAGMAEVSGVLHRLQQTISPGYGYTAILIALLARLNPLSILLVSFLMGGLLVGGFSLQTSGFPSSMVSMFQGSILFFVLAGEIFNNYRLVRKKA
jgi:general nucleoside transport system permease protein